GCVRGVELVELVDEAARLGELVDVDLAAADQLENDLAELGERVVTTAMRACFVETGAAFACAALDRVANDAGLRERGAQERAERAPDLGAKPPTSLTCHDVRVTPAFTAGFFGLPSVSRDTSPLAHRHFGRA